MAVPSQLIDRRAASRCRFAWRQPHDLGVALLFGLILLPGCRMVDDAALADKSPLAAAGEEPRHVVLDVVFVRVPTIEPSPAGDLWEHVDESAIPAAQRRRLAQNGFRVGVIGSELPPALAEVVGSARSLHGNGATTPDEDATGHVGATRRQMLLYAGQRGELIASSVQAEFHVIEINEGELRGETYRDGQAQFSVRGQRNPDGQAAVTLVPEIHHGAFRQKYVPGEGMFRLDTRRDRRICDRLQIEVKLAAGQMLVLGSRPDRSGSLGYRFFHTSGSGAPQQKLLLLRLGGERPDPITMNSRVAANPDSGQ